MNVWQLIGHDHENIEQLIRETPKALNGPGVVRSRERLLGELIDELDTHAAAIEASLYAPLARQQVTSRLAAELYAGHRVVMEQLDRLAGSRRGNAEGWLNAFEDATFLVDQHLHRHKHELIPAAQQLLAPRDVGEATRRFIRAKTRAIQALRRSSGRSLATSELNLNVILCAGAVGLGYLLWRAGYFRGTDTRPRPGVRSPARAHHDGPRARQERLLDEGLEDTFPASDPIQAQRFT